MSDFIPVQAVLSTACAVRDGIRPLPGCKRPQGRPPPTWLPQVINDWNISAADCLQHNSGNGPHLVENARYGHLSYAWMMMMMMMDDDDDVMWWWWWWWWWNYCLSVRFNGHFSTWTWVNRYQNVSILDIVGAKDDGGGEWWQLELRETCKSAFQSNRHH